MYPRRKGFMLGVGACLSGAMFVWAMVSVPQKISDWPWPFPVGVILLSSMVALAGGMAVMIALGLEGDDSPGCRHNQEKKREQE